MDVLEWCRDGGSPLDDARSIDGADRSSGKKHGAHGSRVMVHTTRVCNQLCSRQSSSSWPRRFPRVLNKTRGRSDSVHIPWSGRAVVNAAISGGLATSKWALDHNDLAFGEGKEAIVATAEGGYHKLRRHWKETEGGVSGASADPAIAPIAASGDQNR